MFLKKGSDCLKAKKSLGQNFLIDKNVIEKIISASLSGGTKKVVEVGPGTGALTKKLLEKENISFTAIEIDEELYDYLLKNTNIKSEQLVLGNILDIDLNTISKGEKYSLIANLPYYISSKIIFKFLGDDNCNEMVIMLQKELIDRILSTKNKKMYGRLTVALQSFYIAERVVNVPSKCFKPRPNVDSAVVKLTKINNPNIQNKEQYLDFIKLCFSKKRKTLRNNLKTMYTMDNIKKALYKDYADNWDLIRAENLSVDDFKRLYKLLNTQL